MADENTTYFYSRTQEKCDTEANWEAANPILLKNEVIYVKMADGDTRTKTGDGTSRYKSLPFNDKNFREKVNGKVDKVSGKGLSTNDYTDAEKAEVAKVKDKANVNDVLTKTNATEFTPTSDYHPATKKYVDDFINDAFMMEYEINDSDGGTLLDSNGQPILSRVNVTDAVSELDKNKVDKVSGKDLSTNDFTDTYKLKLDNLDSSLSTKAPAYSYSTTDLTAGTSALATGKLYFVYE